MLSKKIIGLSNKLWSEIEATRNDHIQSTGDMYDSDVSDLSESEDILKQIRTSKITSLDKIEACYDAITNKIYFSYYNKVAFDNLWLFYNACFENKSFDLSQLIFEKNKSFTGVNGNIIRLMYFHQFNKESAYNELIECFKYEPTDLGDILKTLSSKKITFTLKKDQFQQLFSHWASKYDRSTTELVLNHILIDWSELNDSYSIQSYINSLLENAAPSGDECDDLKESLMVCLLNKLPKDERISILLHFDLKDAFKIIIKSKVKLKVDLILTLINQLSVNKNDAIRTLSNLLYQGHLFEGALIQTKLGKLSQSILSQTYLVFGDELNETDILFEKAKIDLLFLSPAGKEGIKKNLKEKPFMKLNLISDLSFTGASIYFEKYLTLDRLSKQIFEFDKVTTRYDVILNFMNHVSEFSDIEIECLKKILDRKKSIKLPQIYEALTL